MYPIGALLQPCPPLPKTKEGCSIRWLSGHGSRCRRNRSQDNRFDDFPAIAPDADETDPRMLDLLTFWPWLQMSTEPIPGYSIWWLSGHGSRCRRNRSWDVRFVDFLAMAPDVDGTDPRMLDLITFWPWLQMVPKFRLATGGVFKRVPNVFQSELLYNTRWNREKPF